MNVRRFADSYGRPWQARTTRFGHSLPASGVSQPLRWTVVFEPVPNASARTCWGSLASPDLDAVPNAELRAALDTAMQGQRFGSEMVFHAYFTESDKRDARFRYIRIEGTDGRAKSAFVGKLDQSQAVRNQVVEHTETWCKLNLGALPKDDEVIEIDLDEVQKV